MNLFDKAKVIKLKKCHNCNKEFTPDKRNTNRGWCISYYNNGLCCSKSCAATYKNKLGRMKGGDLVRELRDMRLSQLGI